MTGVLVRGRREDTYTQRGGEGQVKVGAETEVGEPQGMPTAGSIWERKEWIVPESPWRECGPADSLSLKLGIRVWENTFLLL